MPTPTARGTLERFRHQCHDLGEHGLSDIRDIIAGRRHSLFGHIKSLSANVPAHMALKLSVDECSGTKPKPDWTRPQSRPRNTWVKQLVADSGIAASELWKKARNRKDWVARRPRDVSGEWWWWKINYICKNWPRPDPPIFAKSVTQADRIRRSNQPMRNSEVPHPAAWPLWVTSKCAVSKECNVKQR